MSTVEAEGEAATIIHVASLGERLRYELVFLQLHRLVRRKTEHPVMGTRNLTQCQKFRAFCVSLQYLSNNAYHFHQKQSSVSLTNRANPVVT